MSLFREIRGAGFKKGAHSFMASHSRDCECEECGVGYLLLLSQYEITRLLEELEERKLKDTGDWHGQLRWKLRDVLGLDQP